MMPSCFSKCFLKLTSLVSQWIVDGYSTMMNEVDEQVLETAGTAVNLAVVPVGVGSFAQSAVTHYKSTERSTTLLVVEPESAACLKESLINDAHTPISTRYTIMTGMNCGTVSSIAWPLLRSGIDASISVSDIESHHAVRSLHSMGVSAGPCGAATLAALRIVAQTRGAAVGLNADSVVVLFCTEGIRKYDVPNA